MSDSTSSVSSIVGLPTEILIEIIQYLNAGERIALANTSERFYLLIIEDKQLLRDLDFTQEGRLICGDSLADIKRNLKKPETSNHVPEVNLQNDQLTSTKLENLFDPPIPLINLHTETVKFESMIQLGIFLDPFEHLERLSIEWPNIVMNIGNNFDRFRRAWHARFSRLKYLSVTVVSAGIQEYKQQLLPCLYLCQELKELHITEPRTRHRYRVKNSLVKFELPKNLEIFVFWAFSPTTIERSDCITDPFTNSEEWFVLRLGSIANRHGFYFQKNKEFSAILGTPNRLYHSYDSLLEQVLTKTHEIDVGDLRCLQLNPNAESKKASFRLKTEEINLLLKGPRHEIRNLELGHSIESDCIVHLVASAFPNLTELVLNDIIKTKGSTPQRTHPKNRLKRRGTAKPGDYRNVKKDSSFKMLVENTPHLKSLTIIAHGGLTDDHVWDLNALPLIACWKNLRSLCLNYVPITDGQFLLDIGRQCSHLEKVNFQGLCSRKNCCYLDELCQMLTDCRNLRDFTLEQGGIDDISEVFLSLTNNRELARLDVYSYEEEIRTKYLQLASPVEQLLRHCQKLTSFRFIHAILSDADSTEIISVLTRLRVEPNRPTLRFKVSNKFLMGRSGIVYEEPAATSFHREDLMPYYFPETGLSAAQKVWQNWKSTEILKNFWNF